MFDFGLTESKTDSGHEVAKHALEILFKYYPGYKWYARADGGVLELKCGKIGRASWVFHQKDINGDWTTFEKKLIMGAGELLERAYLRRAQANGDHAKRLDGGEKIKWQPQVH